MNFTWLAVIILAAAAIFFGYNRKIKTAQGTEYRNWPTLCIMASVAAVYLIMDMWLRIPTHWATLFWVTWLLVGAVIAFSKLDPDSRGATLAVAGILCVPLVFTLVFSPGIMSAPTRTVASPDKQVLVLEDRTTKNADDTILVAYHDNESQPGTSSDKPASGENTVNTTYATPSLTCEAGVKSWHQLVTCVNDAPETKREAYIQYVNDHAASLGADWAAIKKLAKAEYQDGKQQFDTRVIVALNTNATIDDIRSAARKAVSKNDNIASLPIVHTDGALLNTRSGITNQTSLEPWANAKSEVRVMLTVPAKGQLQPVSFSTKVPNVANTTAAKNGYGVLVECTNVATGVVKKPHPRPNPTPVVPVPSTPSTPSSSTPATTPPPSTTTPGTPPPSSSTPPPSSTPPSETPPTTPPESTPPPETTPPPSTTPPVETTPPPTTTPPAETCPPDSDRPECSPKGEVPYPTEKPGNNTTKEPVESSTPTYTRPADPSDEPGDPIPPSESVTAPGATQEPDPEPTPSATETAAPDPTAPGTGDVDPDGDTTPVASSTDTGTANAMLGLGAPFLLLGMARKVKPSTRVRQ